ncbi:hypothetical protein OK016_22325 [Vibrio chagasii]|nr:hypothetical protein [Vibrio chagasii]
MTMIDFMTLSDDDDPNATDFGNRHTVIGYEYDFTQAELDSTDATDAGSRRRAKVNCLA